MTYVLDGIPTAFIERDENDEVDVVTTYTCPCGYVATEHWKTPPVARRDVFAQLRFHYEHCRQARGHAMDPERVKFDVAPTEGG